MLPFDQNQHKIPQVYLRQFGYRDRNNQWRVSVMARGEKFIRQKSIESFLSETNVFDIDSSELLLVRMFENLNCELETGYNSVINDLDTNQKLSEKSEAYLLQIITILIIRADYWREWMKEMLVSENKETFLKVIVGHHCKNESEFKNISQLIFYQNLISAKGNDLLNRALLYFADRLLLRIGHYEVVIIQSQPDKPWYTSDNPVVVHNRTQRNEILAKESELYFPLSPKYLVYLHFKGSDDKDNKLRCFASNTIYHATDDQNWSLQNLILENMDQYSIFAGEERGRFD